MYAIAGVTGHTGKVVAETLQAKGQPIRVVVRDEKKGASWKGRGAEVAVASVDDQAALTGALSGTKAVVRSRHRPTRSPQTFLAPARK